MTDPVVDHEGNSYERSAIVLWLSRNATSPVTRAPLSLDHLIPNRALKEMIQEAVAAAAEATTGGASASAGAGAGGGAGGGAASGAASGAAPAPAPGAPPRKGSLRAMTDDCSGAMVAPVLTVHSEVSTDTQVSVMVTLAAPDAPARDPADVCCVVDVSGSMGSEAKLSDKETAAESAGLSLLDVVKHALKVGKQECGVCVCECAHSGAPQLAKLLGLRHGVCACGVQTVVHTLKPMDRFALVSFSSTARVVLPLTLASPDNVRRMLASIESLSPDGSTNIWDGLLKVRAPASSPPPRPPRRCAPLSPGTPA
jgi:Mg-chelatase subunit ChlD